MAKTVLEKERAKPMTRATEKGIFTRSGVRARKKMARPEIAVLRAMWMEVPSHISLLMSVFKSSLRPIVKRSRLTPRSASSLKARPP